jgi:hypothetical protein
MALGFAVGIPPEASLGAVDCRDRPVALYLSCTYVVAVHSWPSWASSAPCLARISPDVSPDPSDWGLDWHWLKPLAVNLAPGSSIGVGLIGFVLLHPGFNSSIKTGEYTLYLKDESGRSL